MGELTSEEIVALQAKAAEVDKITQDKTDLENKLKELEQDEDKVDWRKARRTIKALKEVAEKDGKVFDEENLVVKEAPRAVSTEDMERVAESVAERKLMEKSLLKAKKELNSEDQKTFDRFYSKAIAGEDVNSDNVDEYIELAMTMAGGITSKPAFAPRGGAPRLEKEGDSFADSERGKALTARYFNRK